jgi:hypothetical protein
MPPRMDFFVVDGHTLTTVAALEETLKRVDPLYAIDNHYLRHGKKLLGIVELECPPHRLCVKDVRFALELRFATPLGSGEKAQRDALRAALKKTTAIIRLQVFPEEDSILPVSLLPVLDCLFAHYEESLLMTSAGIYQGGYREADRVVDWSRESQ